MSIENHFKQQLDLGQTDMFFYCLEDPGQTTFDVVIHRGTLNELPQNLEYVKHVADDVPLFRKVSL